MADLHDDELAALAQRTGLTALRSLDAEAFAKAVKTARTMGDGTPRPADVAVEPAHIARFPLVGGKSS